MSIIYKNKQLLLLLASFVLILNVFKKFEVSFNIQILIFSFFSIFMIFRIISQIKNSNDKKRWYYKILIGCFFILTSIGIGVYQYYKIN